MVGRAEFALAALRRQRFLPQRRRSGSLTPENGLSWMFHQIHQRDVSRRDVLRAGGPAVVGGSRPRTPGASYQNQSQAVAADGVAMAVRVATFPSTVGTPA